MPSSGLIRQGAIIMITIINCPVVSAIVGIPHITPADNQIRHLYDGSFNRNKDG